MGEKGREECSATYHGNSSARRQDEANNTDIASLAMEHQLCQVGLKAEVLPFVRGGGLRLYLQPITVGFSLANRSDSHAIFNLTSCARTTERQCEPQLHATAAHCAGRAATASCTRASRTVR